MPTGAPGVVRWLEGDGAGAGGVAADRPGNDDVGAGPVADEPVDRERAAAAAGRAGGAGDAGAVVEDADLPGLAGAVGVELVLDLEAAVVGLGLELPDAGGARAAGALDATLRERRCGRAPPTTRALARAKVVIVLVYIRSSVDWVPAALAATPGACRSTVTAASVFSLR